MDTPEYNPDDLHVRLNRETGRMAWQELLRYFASGLVLVVSDDLDLVDVAACIASDDKESVLQWMSQQRLAQVSDAQASAWLESNTELWTVVVRPWVLVQQNKRLN